MIVKNILYSLKNSIYVSVLNPIKKVNIVLLFWYKDILIINIFYLELYLKNNNLD